MARYFLDSSALAKIYHPEVGTTGVVRILSEPNRRVIISRLTLVELQSVFAIKVRTGEISKEDAEMLRRRLLAQVAAGDFEVFTVGDSHFAAAEQFVIKYGFDYRLRTLDALQSVIISAATPLAVRVAAYHLHRLIFRWLEGSLTVAAAPFDHTDGCRTAVTRLQGEI